MSTLTSSDLNVKRSTTRVHAPPGGVSTISFGNWSEVPASPAKKSASANGEAKPDIAAAVAKLALEVPEEPAVPVTTFKVGLAIVTGPGTESLLGNAVKALASVGIVNVVVLEVPDALMLAYACQRMLKLKCDGVIGMAIITSDAIGTGNGSLSQVLNSSLLQLGIYSESPVIPGIICQSNILEAKALVSHVTVSWARSLAGLLGMSLESCPPPTQAASAPKASPVTPDVADFDTLFAAFKASLKARGASGIIGLARKFKIADDDNSGTLSLEEFKKMAAEHTMRWTDAQTKIIFDHFDEDKSGSISYDEFLQGVRGELNDRRKQLVLMAFEVLDSDKSGVIEMNDITKAYDASKHPDVISGKRTPHAVLKEFLDTFDSAEKDGKVTPKEFCKYYANVSSSIDDDDYFELMIRNAWHISGGEGWCANTSCRRVLAVHADGRQTVEEIKNDLGIKADDKEAMMKNLREQGITDITGIDLFGSLDTTSRPKAPEKRPATAPARTGRRAPGGAATIVLG